MSLVKGSNASPFETRSGDLLTCYRMTNQKISCNCFDALGKCVVSTTIRYTHFHWLIYKLKKPWQEVAKTGLKWGCVRSFQEANTNGERIERANFIIIRLPKLSWGPVACKVHLKPMLKVNLLLIINVYPYSCSW